MSDNEILETKALTLDANQTLLAERWRVTDLETRGGGYQFWTVKILASDGRVLSSSCTCECGGGTTACHVGAICEKGIYDGCDVTSSGCDLRCH